MGRHPLKNPSLVQRRMLDLAIETAKIKTLNLKEIGETVAKEFERAKPFSRQYVEQVLHRWANFYENWQGYDASRPTLKQLKAAIAYAAGKNTEKIHPNYDIIRKLGFKLRGVGKGRHFTMLRKNRFEKIIIPMSEDWKAGIPIKKMADKWNVTPETMGQKIVRYRYKYGRLDLFPLRRASQKPS